MPEVAYPFRDQTEATDTLPRLVRTGSVTLDEAMEDVIDEIPEGWRTVLEIRVFAAGDWMFEAGGGSPVPGPDGVWFSLPGINLPNQEFKARRTGGAMTLYYVLLGK